MPSSSHPPPPPPRTVRKPKSPTLPTPAGGSSSSAQGRAFDRDHPPQAFYDLLRFFQQCGLLQSHFTHVTDQQIAYVDPIYSLGTLPMLHLSTQQEQMAEGVYDALVVRGARALDSTETDRQRKLYGRRRQSPAGDDASACFSPSSSSSSSAHGSPPLHVNGAYRVPSGDGSSTDVVSSSSSLSRWPSHTVTTLPSPVITATLLGKGEGTALNSASSKSSTTCGDTASEAPPANSHPRPPLPRGARRVLSSEGDETAAAAAAAATRNLRARHVTPLPEPPEHTADCPLLLLLQQQHEKQQRAREKQDILAELTEEDRRLAEEHGEGTGEKDEEKVKETKTMQLGRRREVRARHGSTCRGNDTRKHQEEEEGAAAAGGKKERRRRKVFDTEAVLLAPFTLPPSVKASSNGQMLLLEEVLTQGPESLLALSRCPVCATQLHLQSCHIALHTLQLLHTACLAKLAVLPMMLPADVLSLTPCMAVMHVYHLALRLSLSGLTFALPLLQSDEASCGNGNFATPVVAEVTTATAPDGSLTEGAQHFRGFTNIMKTEGEQTAASARGTVAAVTQAIFRLVFALFSGLERVCPIPPPPRRPMPSPAAVAREGEEVEDGGEGNKMSPEKSITGTFVLQARILRALVLAFLSPAGTLPALELLHQLALPPAATHARASSSSSSSHMSPTRRDWPSLAKRSYEQYRSADKEQSKTRTTTARDSREREHCVVVFLSTVFMDLISLRDAFTSNSGSTATALTMVEACAPRFALAAQLMDRNVRHTLNQLYDSTDGTVSSRARRLQALAWLLRAELARLLSATRADDRRDKEGEEEKEEGVSAQDALRQAVRACDAAREFTSFSIVNAVAVAALKSQRTTSGNRSKSGVAWRLWASPPPSSLSSPTLCSPIKASEQAPGSPTDRDGYYPLALLPTVWIRLWSTLCPTIFRSAAADLLLLAPVAATPSRPASSPSTHNPRESNEGNVTAAPRGERAPLTEHKAKQTGGELGAEPSKAGRKAMVVAPQRTPMSPPPRQTGTSVRGGTLSAKGRTKKAELERGGGGGGLARQQQQQQQQKQQAEAERRELLLLASRELRGGPSEVGFWWRWRCHMMEPDPTTFLSAQPCYRSGEDADDDDDVVMGHGGRRKAEEASPLSVSETLRELSAALAPAGPARENGAGSVTAEHPTPTPTLPSILQASLPLFLLSEDMFEHVFPTPTVTDKTSSVRHTEREKQATSEGASAAAQLFPQPSRVASEALFLPGVRAFAAERLPLPRYGPIIIPTQEQTDPAQGREGERLEEGGDTTAFVAAPPLPPPLPPTEVHPQRQQQQQQPDPLAHTASLPSIPLALSSLSSPSSSSSPSLLHPPSLVSCASEGPQGSKAKPSSAPPTSALPTSPGGDDDRYDDDDDDDDALAQTGGALTGVSEWRRACEGRDEVIVEDADGEETHNWPTRMEAETTPRFSGTAESGTVPHLLRPPSPQLPPQSHTVLPISSPFLSPLATTSIAFGAGDDDARHFSGMISRNIRSSTNVGGHHRGAPASRGAFHKKQEREGGEHASLSSLSELKSCSDASHLGTPPPAATTPSTSATTVAVAAVAAEKPLPSPSLRDAGEEKRDGRQRAVGAGRMPPAKLGRSQHRHRQQQPMAGVSAVTRVCDPL